MIDLTQTDDYSLSINGTIFNHNINLQDLIDSGKFQIMDAENLNNIPNMPGNYWILTNEPIYHSFNPEFTRRPKKISINDIEYNIIYNGQGDTIRTRIKAHLYRPQTKGLSDMSGISIDISTLYKQGTKISHNKCLYTKDGKKTPYYESKKQKIKYNDISNFITNDDLDTVTDYCKELNEHSIIYFKNGINIAEKKHQKYSWIVIYYDMSKFIYHPFSDIIEQKWREHNGQPILCSYKCGR